VVIAQFVELLEQLSFSLRTLLVIEFNRLQHSSLAGKCVHSKGARPIARFTEFVVIGHFILTCSWDYSHYVWINKADFSVLPEVTQRLAYLLQCLSDRRVEG